jgi:thiol-disulfide isomerase/thioredoxin
MRKMIVLILVTGITAFSGSLLQAGMPTLSDQGNCPSCASFGVQRLEKGKSIPFSLKGLDGKQLALRDLKGKPVILTFWATWCSPCKNELPTLEKFADGTKGQLSVLAVAVDGENRKKVQRFVEENKISLPVLLDEREQTAHAYRVRGIPTTFLIDENGMMIGAVMGQRDWSVPEARSAVRELFGLR